METQEDFPPGSILMYIYIASCVRVSQQWVRIYIVQSGSRVGRSRAFKVTNFVCVHIHTYTRRSARDSGARARNAAQTFTFQPAVGELRNWPRTNQTAPLCSLQIKVSTTRKRKNSGLAGGAAKRCRPRVCISEDASPIAITRYCKIITISRGSFLSFEKKIHG